MAAVPGVQGQNICPEPGQQAKGVWRPIYARGNDGGPLATTAPPPSVSDVMLQVEALEQMVGVFGDELNALEQKASPVLRMCESPGAGNGPDPTLTPLAMRLRDIAQQLAARIGQLRDIRQRIDL